MHVLQTAGMTPGTPAVFILFFSSFRMATNFCDAGTICNTLCYFSLHLPLYIRLISSKYWLFWTTNGSFFNCLTGFMWVVKREQTRWCLRTSKKKKTGSFLALLLCFSTGKKRKLKLVMLEAQCANLNRFFGLCKMLFTFYLSPPLRVIQQSFLQFDNENKAVEPLLKLHRSPFNKNCFSITVNHVCQGCR